MNAIHHTTAIAALALIASAGLAQDFTWATPSSGSWTNAANWSPMGTPIDPSHNAFVSVLGTYTINIPANISTFDVSVTNPDATVILDPGHIHNLFGDLHNDAMYQVNPNGVGSQTTFAFQNTSTISGNGTIRLGAVDNRAILLVGAGAALTNSASHTIAGFGRLSGDIINNGLIDADISGQVLNYPNGTITNNALMLASAGTIDLTSVVVNQHPVTGVVRAEDGFVKINTTTINNGTVEGINTFVEVDGTSTFNDVTTQGDVRVQAGRLLNINSTLENNGTIGVNLGGVGAQTTINALSDTLITGSGDIRLDGFSNRAQITTTDPAIITNDTDHTIHGYGRIIGDMTNDGQINADVNEQILTISGNELTNNAQMSVTNNAFLDFTSTIVNQSEMGSIDAVDGQVRFGTTTLTGGLLTGTTGLHVINGTSTFNQVTSDHDMLISAGRALNIANSLTNDGFITLNENGVGAQTTLNFLDSTSLTGAGTVLLNGFANRAQITAESGMTFTHGADHTIMGYGRITADMVNDGNINATVDTQRLTILSPSVQNNSTMSALDGGILELMNSGSLTQSSGAQILSDNSSVELSGTTIVGGALNALNGGTFVVDADSTLDEVTSDAELTVNPGRTLTLSRFLVNNGLINININGVASQTTLMLTEPLVVSGAGSIDLDGFYNRAQIASLSGTDTLTNAAGHTISGTGRIATPLQNNGTLSIGASVGEMDADAPITMGSTGIMMTEVNNFNSADILDSTSTFHAAGTLNIALIDGFAPSTAWIATIVTADGGVTGSFDTVNFPGAPADPRLVNQVGYFDNEIRIGSICKSDVNFSGDVDFLDISQFLGDYNTGNLRADLNGDMELDFLDISAFLSAFNASCP